MTNHYPDRYRHLRAAIKDLAEAAPGPMAGFAALHAKAVAGGALDARTKELIALAIAVAVRCDGASPTTSTTRSRPARPGRSSPRRSAWR